MELTARLLGSLRRHPVWKEASDVTLRGLLRRGRVRDLRTAEAVVEVGQPVSSVYFLVDGAVRVFYPATSQRGELTVKMFAAPASFGSAEALVGGVHSQTIECLVASRVVAVEPAWYFDVLRGDPDLCFAHYKELAQQFAVEIAFVPDAEAVRERVLAIFIAYASQFGSADADGWIVIDKLLSQQKLARQSGTTERTLGRVLNQLYDEKLVARKGRRFIVAPIEQLVANDTRRRANIAFRAEGL